MRAKERVSCQASCIVAAIKWSGRMSKNPWTRELFAGYLQQEEGPEFEFKSSTDLLTRGKWSGYIQQLCRHASAFLNGDGGRLLLGLEEANRKDQPDIATALSPGIPRSVLTAAQLE